MNALSPITPQRDSALQKRHLVGVLERLCRTLEPTDTEWDQAKDRSQAVGNWLAEADVGLFSAATIYHQGSFAVGTAIRPMNGNEYDVDLVCRFTNLGLEWAPADLKRLLGGRLRANGKYAPILQEMPRCWRLNYANEFHLDITPSVPNLSCGQGGELVPDKALQCWKASNPRGFRDLFNRRARLAPRMRVLKSMMSMDRASVESFPEQTSLKGILRRTIQIAKRHRDVYFEQGDASLRPISVILTTLAAQAYEFCVAKFEYDSEFDLLVAVLRMMPVFIEQGFDGGRKRWYIWNETTKGENFAEKWNSHPERAAAFFEWHGRLIADLEHVSETPGLDRLTKSLSTSFGSIPANRAVASFMEDIGTARRAGTLAVAPMTGITVGTTAARSTPVRTNTFFGAAEG